jgi:hypothetical protein
VPNVQQPEMRRSEENPLVQDSKRPDDTDRPAAGGRGNRPVPAGQASPYGPRPAVADDDSDADEQPR